MIIIVEGIDRVGKTTLCNKLSKELNIPIYKNNGIIDYKDMNNVEETDKMLKLIDLCKLTNADIIFDRFHLSDYTYGIIEREYNVFNAAKNLLTLDNNIADYKDVFLILIEPVDIDKSSTEHGRDLSKHNKMIKAIFSESKIKNKWRCTYNTMNEALLFIKSKMEVNNEKHRL